MSPFLIIDGKPLQTLSIWTGAGGSPRRQDFPLTLPLEELLSRDDFGDFCADIERNVGVLDYMGEDDSEGFSSDVEAQDVETLHERFCEFLAARGLLAG